MLPENGSAAGRTAAAEPQGGLRRLTAEACNVPNGPILPVSRLRGC